VLEGCNDAVTVTVPPAGICPAGWTDTTVPGACRAVVIQLTWGCRPSWRSCPTTLLTGRPTSAAWFTSTVRPGTDWRARAVGSMAAGWRPEVVAGVPELAVASQPPKPAARTAPDAAKIAVLRDRFRPPRSRWRGDGSGGSCRAVR